jgi:translocation and assembly module TamB
MPRPALPQWMFRRPRLDPELTPEQREQRIAELRALRQERMRALARRSAFTSLGLMLLVLVFAWWLLGTLGGRDFLLAQLVARLPPDATLTWRRAEGPVRGPLVLHGVRFTIPKQLDPDCEATIAAPCATGLVVFTARRMTLDAAIGRMSGRTLRLDTLEVVDARLDLPETDRPFELPRWPDVLPDVEPPLPLRVDAIDVAGMVVTREGVPVADIARLRGGLRATSGRLQMDDVTVASDRGRFAVDGVYVPRDDYRMDLTARAVLAARPGRTPARLGLVARGDLSDMQVALAGNAPGALRASLRLEGRERPRWQLEAVAEALDFGLLTDPRAAPGEPLRFDLTVDGTGGDARVHGTAQRGDLAAILRPSRIRLEDQVLQLDPLHVDLMEGRVVARGTADLREDGDGIALALDARGLTWGGAADGEPIVADADVDVAGALEDWTVAGTAGLARAGERAALRIDGRGDRERLRLRSLAVEMPTGRLDATGTVAWAPGFGWDLDARLAGFDPAYFLDGWNGAVDGVLASRGRGRADGGLDATVTIADLGGRLRGRPLDGNGRILVRAPTRGSASYEGEIALSIGNSRIDARGRIADALSVDASFAPLHLADLLPDAAGSLRGTVQLRGARDAPDIDADLSGSGIRYGAFEAQSLQASGRLPWRGSGGSLVVRVQGLQAGMPFDSLVVDARGAMEALRLDAQARGDAGALDLSGRVARRGNDWRGTVASLRLAPRRGAPWTLQQPAALRWSAGSFALDDACLASGEGGRLCADADWPRRGLEVAGRELPLSLVAPWLPERADGRPWLLRGQAALDARVRPAGNAWIGEATLVSNDGGLRFSERARRDVVGWQALRIGAEFNPQRIAATLDARLFDGDPLTAQLETGWDEYAPLSGSISFDTDELTWMELFSPDIVSPTGSLTARIALGGTRAQPALGGDARLTGFATEIPALGLDLTDGNLRMDAQPDGSARIAGSVRSGRGVLDVDGSLGWRGDDVPLVLNLRGSDVLVSDTRDLFAVADPDVTVRYTAGQPIEVTGTVTVPEALIDLERLDRGVSPSPDVVILDPVDPEDDGIATPLVLDLTLVLGEDVRMRGFGLDGGLDGRLRVQQRPGRQMTARGQLQVDGRYRAYGQRLDITRGTLVWTGGPVGDPVLDISAERDLGDVTAGVAVRGRASAPEATVWSNPATSQSEALSYLALGRPLSAVSGAERDQLNAANAALSAGGSLIASQLAASIGLDDAGVLQSRSLGGSVFGVGKYLSPRLYVGYGVSLLGTGQVLTLKYLLRRGFDVEIESSTIENRASLNWRIER